MTVATFLDDLRHKGVQLWADGDRLRYRAPQGVLTAELLTALAEHKAAILTLLRDGNDAPQHGALPQIEPDPGTRYEPFPLTDIQQAYWIGRMGSLELGNVATHVYLELDGGALDLDRFRDAWQRLIDRHDMLRAIVREDGLQQILPHVPPYALHVADVRPLPSDARAAHLEAIRQELSHQVLPADTWPLFDLRATILDDEQVRLHISLDMLILDAWSLRLLVRELAALYHQPERQLPPLALSFRDYVLAERTLRDTSAYRRAQDYWWERLPTLPPAPELPLVRQPESLRHPRFVRRSGRLERDTWQRLKQQATQHGLTPSALLAAAFAEILTTWSTSSRFTINLTLFNRLPLHPQVHDIVGDFTATTLLMVDNAAGDTFAARAERVQTQLWSDLEHSQISGVRVLRELARIQGEGARAVMPVVFTSTLINQRVSQEDQPTLGWQLVHSISQTPQVWLDHQVSEQAGALVFNWDAVDDLFPGGMLDDMFGAYCQLLQRLAESKASWQSPLSQVDLARYDGIIQRHEHADSPALRAPDDEALRGADTPSRALVREISGLVADILDLSDVDPRANLLDLGANSVEIIRIANRMERELGFRPKLEDFYRSPTVVGLARAYEHQRHRSQPPSASARTESELDRRIGAIPLLVDPVDREVFKQRQPGLRPDDQDKPRIPLDRGDVEAALSAYTQRHSHRHFVQQPIPWEAFRTLLGCLRQVTLDEHPKYLYPSAGGLYPIQTYLHVRPQRVEGLTGGIYYYHPVGHWLTLLTPDVDLDRTIHDPFVNGPVFDEAAFSIFLIAQLSAIAPMYGNQSWHYATLEAGYIGQLLMMSAPHSRIGLCPIGSLDFDRIRHLFALDQTHVLVHSLLGGGIDPDCGVSRSSAQEVAYGMAPAADDREEIEL
ncbi:MAG TPA: condensation domain-containing protein [Herpetosiphonaceae bacterium]